MRVPRAHIVIAISALAIIGGGAVLLVRRGGGVPQPVAPPLVVVASAPDAKRNWMDGSVLATDAVQPHAVAVILDNAPEARPQSGIADASVVLEVPVEGGRTRFLALFSSTADVREVGPVRSARPYFAALAHAFGAPLVHVGGSTAALEFLRAQQLPHINQYFDPPFRRVDFRKPPFNVYASIPDLAGFAAAQRLFDSALDGGGDDRTPWTFSEEVLTGDIQPAPDVRITYGTHVTTWSYDPAVQAYARSQDGRTHRDANGKPVTAANVLVLWVSNVRVLDDVGRLAITFPADTPARAAIYRDGVRQPSTWVLPSEGRTVFHMAVGAKLRPGTTWIELVSDATLVE